MTISRFERWLIALMLALLAAGVTLIIAQAQSVGKPLADTQAPQCAVCHTEFQMTWQAGPHGQAGSDPVFLAQWTAQGKPGACLVCHVTGYDPATASWEEDGVACEACHSPAPADHPKSPMPVDRSTDLCGRCHSDTRFGWQAWKVSTHYQRGMDCTVCHDPHGAALKKAAPLDGHPSFEDASQLCITCHRELSMDFPYSTHHQQGLSCVDCHVRHLELDERTAHTVPDHSFNASLETCTRCHASQMHGATQASQTGTAPASPLAAADAELASLTSEPSPVSPLGFAGLAALIGLAAGMILAPWLERLYRRAAQHKGEADDE